MPPQLEKYGLAESIKDCCRTLNGSVQFRCRITGLSKKLPDYIELMIYRIVQELSLNVAKHSRAKSATVEIMGRLASAIIRVKDNGVGIPMDKVKKSGIGLDGIKKTIRLLGGKFDLRLPKGCGTEIEIFLPYPK